MAVNRKFIQGQDFFLDGSGVSATATSIDLTSFTLPDGTLITTDDIGALGYITFEPETSFEENASFTGVTQNDDGTATLTGVTRGLRLVYPYEADADLTYAHFGASRVRITNSAPFYNDFANKENDETVSGLWTFDTDNRPALDVDEDADDDAQLITHGELTRTAISGAVPANTVDAGIVKIATDAQLAAGTATSGSYSLVPNGGSFNAVAAATKVPVSKSNSKLAGPWVAMTTAGDTVYFDGTDIQRLGPTTARYLRMNVTTPEWGGANLDEANTFFGVTNITGAQANTLVGGTTSDASSLHTHNDLVTSFSFNFHENTGGSGSPVAKAGGFSDATTKLIGACVFDGGVNQSFNLCYACSNDIGAAPFYSTLGNDATTAATVACGMFIGSDYWNSDSSATAGNRIQKNGSAVTISGTTPSASPMLAHDVTNSYLLVLDTSTRIRRYSGISGTTITNIASDITLANAVNNAVGFMYDNTNQRYICVDTANSLIRRFGSTGTLIDSVAFTVPTTNITGVCFIKDRVYLQLNTAIGTFGATPGLNFAIGLVPTTMTR